MRRFGVCYKTNGEINVYLKYEAIDVIFIHPPRTSGTSIEYQIMKDLNIAEKHNVLSSYGKKAEDAFVFATIRNPYDILASKFKINWYNPQGYTKLSDEFSLEDTFLHWLKAFVSVSGSIHNHEKGNSLSDYLDGRVDFYIRHENRKHHIDILNEEFSKREIPLHIDHNVKIANSYDKQYRDFYNEEAKEIATEFYKEDLDRFDYQF